MKSYEAFELALGAQKNYRKEEFERIINRIEDISRSGATNGIFNIINKEIVEWIKNEGYTLKYLRFSSFSENYWRWVTSDYKLPRVYVYQISW